MSADVLRRAALVARLTADTYFEESPQDINGRIHVAVADWLDAEADREAYHLAEFGHRIVPNEAAAVARAYLGEAP